MRKLGRRNDSILVFVVGEEIRKRREPALFGDVLRKREVNPRAQGVSATGRDGRIGGGQQRPVQGDGDPLFPLAHTCIISSYEQRPTSLRGNSRQSFRASLDEGSASRL